jgi:hypothetical protein
MKRSLLVAVAVASLVSASAQAQSASDEFWRNSTFVRSGDTSYGALRGAFNVIEKEKSPFGPTMFESMRSGTYIVKYSDTYGFGASVSPIGRSFGVNYFVGDGAIVRAGYLRNSNTGVRGAAITFEKTWR